MNKLSYLLIGLVPLVLGFLMETVFYQLRDVYSLLIINSLFLILWLRLGFYYGTSDETARQATWWVHLPATIAFGLIVLQYVIRFPLPRLVGRAIIAMFRPIAYLSRLVTLSYVSVPIMMFVSLLLYIGIFYIGTIIRRRI